MEFIDVQIEIMRAVSAALDSVGLAFKHTALLSPGQTINGCYFVVDIAGACSLFVLAPTARTLGGPTVVLDREPLKVSSPMVERAICVLGDGKRLVRLFDYRHCVALLDCIGQITDSEETFRAADKLSSSVFDIFSKAYGVSK